jgi:hypothetical protein
MTENCKHAWQQTSIRMHIAGLKLTCCTLRRFRDLIHTRDSLVWGYRCTLFTRSPEWSVSFELAHTPPLMHRLSFRTVPRSRPLCIFMLTALLGLPLTVLSASAFATSRIAPVLAQNSRTPVQRRTFECTMADTSYESRWEKQWSAGLSKHQAFDKGGTSPALQQLLDQGVLPKGRALVPGSVPELIRMQFNHTHNLKVLLYCSVHCC